MTSAELKAARESLNLTQVKMARLLGMTQPHYCRLEKGREGRQPTKQQARAVEILQIIYEQNPSLLECILSKVKD
jgi:transcriptional regulator with XRE-family HTH domain